VGEGKLPFVHSVQYCQDGVGGPGSFPPGHVGKPKGLSVNSLYHQGEGRTPHRPFGNDELGS
jgi:hypothetical protein